MLNHASEYKIFITFYYKLKNNMFTLKKKKIYILYKNNINYLCY